ncbi:hypothetical protein U5801_28080 [Lamprobacter modestohalophilus]|uniref:hypothetical protein n=1 Tax=Lamprobacter modestohalophilus TaxID=1064514 RepID=UPI002ADEBE7D|nr:hypothetical protein [Lamprobacter modestohalophilus]MEA1053635.1 hypothetical protein [Lamprobacter modestohalophilus]
MEKLPILMSLVGSTLAAYGALSLLLKPGVLASFCRLQHDAGVSKIVPVVHSAAQIAAGFVWIALASLSQLDLFPQSPGLLITTACILTYLLLVVLTKRVIARETDWLKK